MNAHRYAWEKDRAENEALRFYFEACTREPLAWKEEVYAAARTIADKTKKPIWVCSSGGIDSEIACRAFFDQGIDFSVLTLRHAGGTNDHDIKYAIEWCRARGVHQKIVSIDMEHFLTKEVDEYMKKYVAVHPYRYFQIKLMSLVEQMGGYAVICSGEQIYRTDPEAKVIERKDMYMFFSIGNTVPFEWCKDNNTDHEAYFYYTTPELCLSYLRLPLVKFVLDNPEQVFRHKRNTFVLKRLVYQGVWPDIEPRFKLDGFENLQPLIDDALRRMKNSFGSKLVEFRLSIPEFERQLSAGIF
jgi:hypothetical protein